MKKFPIFTGVFLLVVAAGALGMRLQGISGSDLLGVERTAQIKDIFDFSDAVSDAKKKRDQEAAQREKLKQERETKLLALNEQYAAEEKQAQAEYEELIAENAALEKDLEEQIQAAQGGQEEKDRMEQELQDKIDQARSEQNQDIALLQTQLDELQSAKENIKQELEGSLAKIREEGAKKTAELAEQLRNTENEKERIVTELQAALDAAQGGQEAEIAKLQADLDVAREDKENTANQMMEQIARSQEEQKQRATELRGQLAALQAEKTKVMQELQDKLNQIDTTQIATLEKEVADAQKELGEIQETVEIDENAQKMADLKTKIGAALGSQDYKKALELSEDLVEIGDTEADFFSGVIFGAIVKLDKPDRALKLARIIADQNPQSAKAWNYVGWAALEDNELNEADEALGKALGLDQKMPEIYLNYGDLYVRQEEWTRAAESYNMAIELDGPEGAITTLAKQRLAGL